MPAIVRQNKLIISVVDFICETDFTQTRWMSERGASRPRLWSKRLGTGRPEKSYQTDVAKRFDAISPVTERKLTNIFFILYCERDFSVDLLGITPRYRKDCFAVRENK